jgi:hypothetical protein
MRAPKGKLRVALRPQALAALRDSRIGFPRRPRANRKSGVHSPVGDTTVVGLVAQTTTAPGASPSPASCLYVQMLQGSLPPATRNVVLDVFREMHLVGVTFVEAQYLLPQLEVYDEGAETRWTRPACIDFCPFPGNVDASDSARPAQH